jgi:cell fate (sporulation/competence/biofilm development) regulator YmcA (YheA/YmcA/DUF963 family)
MAEITRFTTQMEDKLSLILSDPIVSEYVALLADLNESIQAVQDYINNALTSTSDV